MADRIPLPVIDLFAGPGGLGEGFSSTRTAENRQCFRVRLSIEKDAFAHRTLLLRAFFRQFSTKRVPALYYDVLRGRTSTDALFSRFVDHAEKATSEAWNAELGTESGRHVRDRISAALGNAAEWVLIGGPPCQAYSVAGRSRNKGIDGYRAERDERQYLYSEYLRIIADHWPAVFVMENVKGLLSATLRNRGMFERIHEDLSAPGRFADQRNGRNHTYRIISISPRADLFGDVEVDNFLVQAERHGIPQARHRVILLGVRDDLRLPPDESYRLPVAPHTAARAVLDGLPRLRSGVSDAPDSADQWLRTLKAERERRWIGTAKSVGGSDVQELIVRTIDKLKPPAHDRGAEFIPGDYPTSYETEWFADGRIEGVCNHSTREHISRDLHRYLYAACYARCHGQSPLLRHFPADLLPAHRNVELALTGHGYFGDRFRVQVAERPSTTITSHISKDGHAFIHPDPSQCRALTVREAARLQTFPDNYLFCGPRTQQYVQVGNAVPPLLARGIARVVWTLLRFNGLAE